MKKPSRKNIRLESWDYSNHAYYHVTICTHQKQPWLSHIDSRTYEVMLTDIGTCVDEAIKQSCSRYPCARVKTYVIMPNHVHTLIAIEEHDVSLGRFIGFMKSTSTRNARKIYPGIELWQRNYYDHILRGDEDYHATWKYIAENPMKWAADDYYIE